MGAKQLTHRKGAKEKKQMSEEIESKQALLTFSSALVEVKLGKKIQRIGWNGAGLVVKIQRPDENSKMTLPYLYIEYPENAKTTPGARCPWLASQTDILAEDWQVVS